MASSKDEFQRVDARARLKPIFKFSKSIRFIAVLDREGKTVAGEGRPGLVSLEPEDATAGIFARALIVSSMAEAMNKYHGKVRTAIVIREKIILICFMTPGRIYFLSADPEFPIGRVEELGQMLDSLNIP